MVAAVFTADFCRRLERAYAACPACARIVLEVVAEEPDGEACALAFAARDDAGGPVPAGDDAPALVYRYPGRCHRPGRVGQRFAYPRDVCALAGRAAPAP